MENLEALRNIDNFCKVLVKKTTADKYEIGNRSEIESPDKEVFERNNLNGRLEDSSRGHVREPELEEPLIDIFDDEDHIKILVQCRCREQQVTFYPSKDGITICREECSMKKGSSEICTDVCSKLSLRTDELQLENMVFIIAKCNNNNTLEAMIPKIKQLI